MLFPKPRNPGGIPGSFGFGQCRGHISSRTQLSSGLWPCCLPFLGWILRLSCRSSQEGSIAPGITTSCNSVQKQKEKRNVCFFSLLLHKVRDTFPRSLQQIFFSMSYWLELGQMATTIERKCWEHEYPAFSASVLGD